MLRIHHIFIALCLCLLSTNTLTAKTAVSELEKRDHWVDSVMTTLNTRERIAQLFMVACYPSLGDKYVEKITQYIKEQKIGGILFSVGHPKQIAQLANQFQSQSNVPLLMSIDGEWGVAMRVDSTIRFPRQMTLGAIADNQLIYEMGVEVAKQCRALGIQLNFAPVVDINNNPNNPVINTRSFGENKHKVAEKGAAYMRGMQDFGILTCAKHFPGHGDTNQDSHKELPLLKQSAKRIDTLELFPFRALINDGIDGVMIAHLDVPSLDTTPVPATLSKKIISTLLKDRLEFNGLVFTDALNMKGITKTQDIKHIPLMALMAGCDILLQPEEVGYAINEIEQAIDSGLLTKQNINVRCQRILEAKYNAGLSRDLLNRTDSVYEQLNTPQAQALNYKLAEAAITLISNRNDLLPLKRLDTLKVAYLEVGGEKRGEAFKQQLRQYMDVTAFTTGDKPRKETYTKLEKELKAYNLIIVGYHNTDSRPQKNFGIDDTSLAFIEQLAASKKVVFDFFGTPYGIAKLKKPSAFNAILVSYNDSKESQNRSAQAIFGGVKVSGTLPITINKRYPEGFGIPMEQVRLKYAMPEELAIPNNMLSSIDSMVNVAIQQKATPGCQVLAAYKGVVFYQKAFGKQSYDAKAPSVTLNDLYDVASVTKVTATLPVVIKAVSEGKLKLDDSLASYLPELEATNKAGLHIRDILSHQAGLQAWIQYYRNFYKEQKSGKELYSDTQNSEYPNRLLNQPQYLSSTAYLDPNAFSRKRSDKFCVAVTDSLFASKEVASYVKITTDNAELQDKVYRYSDMGLMYMQRVVEAIYKQPLDKLDAKLFYKPLGMTRAGFNPLSRFSKKEIVPTEQDNIFRKQRVQGTVHDPAAAMLGGVSGHAGLFATANDLAKLLQLYLNNGTYGGEHYFDSPTMNEFTRTQFPEKGNRRALGFDKPELKTKSNVCPEISESSYGHSGFTGTFVWVDPERELIYVFLSNRTFPDSDNNKLSQLNLRTNILSKLCQAVDVAKKESSKTVAPNSSSSRTAHLPLTPNNHLLKEEPVKVQAGVGSN